MHWNILIYKVTSTSKAFTLPYHIASYAWCPEIICAVSLSCTSLHPWDSPLIPLAFILPEAYHTAFWTFVWTLFSIMLKLETKCLATYCPSWLIDFWQQLIQSGIGRYSRSSVELSCSWKQRSPETPLATSCMGGGDVPWKLHLYCVFWPPDTICDFLPQKGQMGAAYSLCQLGKMLSNRTSWGTF